MAAGNEFKTPMRVLSGDDARQVTAGAEPVRLDDVSLWADPTLSIAEQLFVMCGHPKELAGDQVATGL